MTINVPVVLRAGLGAPLTVAQADSNIAGLANGIATAGSQIDSAAAGLAAGSGASLVGFQQAGAGAIARTSQSKLRELLTVTDYPNMQTAYNSLPATGGVVLVPAGYAETWSANLVMNKPFSGFIFMGPATITMGSWKLVMNDSCPGQFIDTWGAVSGGDYWAQITEGVFFKYTNPATNTVAMQIGQGTLQGSGQDVFRRLRGFALNIETAGTGTIGIQVNNQLRMTIDGVNVKAAGGGAGGAIGLQLNAVGTGYVGWVNVRDSFFNGGMVGVATVGQCNLNTWVGGGCSTSTTAGTSWGILRGTNGGSGFTASSIEIAGATRAVELQSGVSFDTYQVYGESNTYDVYFDTGATYNSYQNTAASTAPTVSDGNGAGTSNIALGAGSIGAANVYLSGNNSSYLYGKTSSGNYRQLIGYGPTSTAYYGNIVADVLTHQFLGASGTLGLLNAAGFKVTGGLGVNGATPPSQVVGWGTPTGAAVQSNFSGTAATLVQCSAAIAKIITDLKAIGIYGA